MYTPMVCILGAELYQQSDNGMPLNNVRNVQ
jgi:hypothetical protein